MKASNAIAVPGSGALPYPEDPASDLREECGEIPKADGNLPSARGASTRVRVRIGLAMLCTVAAIAAFRAWDASQQSEAAIQELMEEEHLLASVLAKDLAGRADQVADPSKRDGDLTRELTALHDVERQGNRLIFLWRRERGGFEATDGRTIANRAIELALAEGARGVILPRDQAASLGLPGRVAVAGVAESASGSGRSVGVVVIASAQRERDRSRREEWRDFGSLFFAVLAVLGFGGYALARERRELSLRQAMVVHRSERERDAQIARADRMAALAAMSTGIAHEIATPLGVIGARVELLAASPGLQDRPDDARVLAIIAAQVERIDGVMRGFLALARGDAPTLVPLAAGAMAMHAASVVAHRFEANGVILERAVDSDAVIAGDPALLEQVVVNLLVNALEASTPGHKVTLSVTSVPQGVEIVVADEGAGVSPSVLAKATDPFFTTKASRGGSGLGLAISKEIVQHHGGTLRIARRDAERPDVTLPGTRVVVRLPAQPEDSP